MIDSVKKDTLKKQMDIMMATVDTLKIDDIKSTSVQIRLGGQVYDLVASASDILPEDQIRKEIEEKLSAKREAIREAVKSKMNEVSAMVSSIQEEYDRKERLLKDTLAKSAPMPDVTWSHAQRGLSCVKGNNRGEIIWLVKRTYNPKFIDHKPIEPLYVKKLMTQIYIRITTVDKKILGVSSHMMHNLDYFDHYHQSTPDCWGNWKRPSTWEKADDILKIADDAIAVMENINTMSIAHRTPTGMPKLETLRRHVMKDVIIPPTVKVSATGLREGLGVAPVESDVWGM